MPQQTHLNGDPKKRYPNFIKRVTRNCNMAITIQHPPPRDKTKKQAKTTRFHRWKIRLTSRPSIFKNSIGCYYWSECSEGWDQIDYQLVCKLDANFYRCDDELYDWGAEIGGSLCVWAVGLEAGVGVEEKVCYR